MHNEHYTFSGIQPWDVIDAWGLDYYQGNILKYICRMGRKEGEDPLKDAEKVLAYAQRLVDNLRPQKVTTTPPQPPQDTRLDGLEYAHISIQFDHEDAVGDYIIVGDLRDILRGFMHILEKAGYDLGVVEKAIVYLGLELQEPIY